MNIIIPKSTLEIMNNLQFTNPIRDEGLKESLLYNRFMAVVQNDNTIFFRLYMDSIDEAPSNASWYEGLGGGKVEFENHIFKFEKGGLSFYNGEPAKIYCDNTVSNVVQLSNPELHILAML